MGWRREVFRAAAVGCAGGAHEISAKTAAHQAVVVTGAAGYVAVVAGGELAPFLEGKRVVLARAIDGKVFGPGHWRVVVPGDGHGAGCL